MSELELSGDEVRDLFYEENSNFEIVDIEDWVQDHKYQYTSFVVKELATGKHYACSISRSGSYHTDWYYSFEHQGEKLQEVQLVEKTIVVRNWEPV